MSSRIQRLLGRQFDFASEWMREGLEQIEEKRLLHQMRGSNAICWEASDEPEPLVTVRIATFNSGNIVADRAVSSVINQTYTRLQILVIGDQCDEQTARAIRSMNDPRICFVNLP